MDTALLLFRLRVLRKNITMCLEDALSVAYKVLISDTLLLISFIFKSITSKNWINLFSKKINKKLDEKLVGVYVVVNEDTLLELAKIKVNGKWHYILGEDTVPESKILPAAYLLSKIKKLPRKGKPLKPSNITWADDSYWTEIYVHVNTHNHRFKVVTQKVVDLSFKKGNLSEIVKLLKLKYKHYFRVSNSMKFLVSLTSLFLYKDITPHHVTKNYDALDSQIHIYSTGVSRYSTKPNLPKELVLGLLKFIKLWLVSLLVSVPLIITLFFLRDIPINKHLFAILSLLAFTYLLVSGFVFFLKKYRYGKYTTAMHRFWRRSFSIFWALEGFLFVVFMYLTVLANQEPFFMYDNIQFFKDYTYSWRLFLSENIIVLLIATLLHLVLIRVKDITGQKLSIIILAVSVLYFFLTYVEFYQFYYTVSHYNPTVWVFDYEFSKWYIDFETTQTKRTRILLHFVTICLIAKFWHFIFILIFWVFSVSKWIQFSTISYQLMGANLQNAIILYLLNWILMYPWAKVAFRKFLYRHYKWLYVNLRSIGSRVFYNDIIIYTSYSYSNLCSSITNLRVSHTFLYYNILGKDLIRSDFTINLMN